MESITGERFRSCFSVFFQAAPSITYLFTSYITEEKSFRLALLFHFTYIVD